MGPLGRPVPGFRARTFPPPSTMCRFPPHFSRRRRARPVSLPLVRSAAIPSFARDVLRWYGRLMPDFFVFPLGLMSRDLSLFFRIAHGPFQGPLGWWCSFPLGFFSGLLLGASGPEIFFADLGMAPARLCGHLSFVFPLGPDFQHLGCRHRRSCHVVQAVLGELDLLCPVHEPLADSPPLLPAAPQPIPEGVSGSPVC